MIAREIRPNVSKIGAIDWNRRLFDALIPLPDGTSYNAYLVKGSEKTVLIDTVDPAFVEVLREQLAEVKRVDFIVANHAEQDHSGAIAQVLQWYPEAVVLCSDKCKPMLVDHLLIDPSRVRVVADGEKLSLGDKTLEFIHTPWVHWPETISTYLVEDHILFSCDFFGAHLATSDLYVHEEWRVYEAAKRYYGEIMMPFRAVVQKNLAKVDTRVIDFIAPSHGPVYDKPRFIIDAYKDWTNETPRNEVVIPYVTMHGSTLRMVEHLSYGLAARGVRVCQFDMSCTDLGKLVISLVDAATIVVGAPTVLATVHPGVVQALFLANAVRPKAKFVTYIGSYGWHSKAVEAVTGLISAMKVQVLDPIMVKGFPLEKDLVALDGMAEMIATKHAEMGLR